jgi:hypothetical protein
LQRCNFHPGLLAGYETASIGLPRARIQDAIVVARPQGLKS